MHVQKLLERAYGRVNRAKLRDFLLSRCAAAGVTYVSDVVTDIDARPDAETVQISTAKGDQAVRARLANLAGGAVSSKFLDFEAEAPRVAAQTAYGVTARVKNYSDAYEPNTMVFMDYRRLHRLMPLYDQHAYMLEYEMSIRCQSICVYGCTPDTPVMPYGWNTDAVSPMLLMHPDISIK